MADLRAIAEAATPGPWAQDRWQVHEDVSGDAAYIGDAALQANARHIAAWSPDRALAALAVIEQSEVVLAALPVLTGAKDGDLSDVLIAVGRYSQALDAWKELTK